MDHSEKMIVFYLYSLYGLECYIIWIYTYRMKAGLALLLLLAVSAVALETYTEDQLDQSLHENRQIWLVYRSRTSSTYL